MRPNLFAALFVGALALVASRPPTAEAVWVGSGWRAEGTLDIFSPTAGDSVIFAVSAPPFVVNNATVSAASTFGTPHVAASLCASGAILWGPLITVPNVASVTAVCPGITMQGGVFVDAN